MTSRFTPRFGPRFAARAILPAALLAAALVAPAAPALAADDPAADARVILADQHALKPVNALTRDLLAPEIADRLVAERGPLSPAARAALETWIVEVGREEMERTLFPRLVDAMLDTFTADDLSAWAESGRRPEAQAGLALFEEAGVALAADHFRRVAEAAPDSVLADLRGLASRLTEQDGAAPEALRELAAWAAR